MVQIDIEHHHNKKEQHHHRTDIDQNQGDREKLGLEQHPDPGGVEKCQNEIERSMNRVARGHHTQGRHDQHRREDVKQGGFEVHGYD